MTFILAIFLGLIIAIVGIIIPGMLNMTIAKLSVKENQTQALNFALGAVFVVFIQCFLGTYFAKFLDANPVFSDGLKKIGTFIFIELTIAFLVMGFNAKKKKNIDVKVENKKNRFIHGMVLSSFNMFAIPWYALTSLMMSSKELFQYDIHKYLHNGEFNVGRAVWVYRFKLWFEEERKKHLEQNTDFKIVISDVRFLHEIEVLKSMGGTIIDVERPSIENIDLHVSEVEIKSFEADYKFINSGTIEELYSKVDEYLKTNLSYA